MQSFLLLLHVFPLLHVFSMPVLSLVHS